MTTRRIPKQVQISYTTQLRKIARAVGDIVNGRYDGSNDSVTEIMDALERYSEIIDGWANQVATGFAASIARHSEKEWRENSQLIGAELRHVINNTPTGHVMRSIVTEQVKYIKSLPLEAAGRIYDIQNRAIENMAAGGRADAFAKEIAASGDVAASRAKLIARTEVGRAVTALTQARSTASGSMGYIWRTAHDGDVRHSHAEMEGKFVYWTDPPTLDGMTGHAGALPNCRCWCEVVFPDGDLIAAPHPSR
ncbi:phage minor head protein [Pantoea ananatis]|uniref:phage head morphogenesis protein n=1 Tax=Pantoea ananas TaxID=553 RepID=UPI001B3178D2|nr:phage minor head protein [Pantoea ananatis]